LDRRGFHPVPNRECAGCSSGCSCHPRGGLARSSDPPRARTPVPPVPAHRPATIGVTLAGEPATHEAALSRIVCPSFRAVRDSEVRPAPSLTRSCAALAIGLAGASFPCPGRTPASWHSRLATPIPTGTHSDARDSNPVASTPRVRCADALVRSTRGLLRPWKSSSTCSCRSSRSCRSPHPLPHPIRRPPPTSSTRPAWPASLPGRIAASASCP